MNLSTVNWNLFTFVVGMTAIKTSMMISPEPSLEGFMWVVGCFGVVCVVDHIRGTCGDD